MNIDTQGFSVLVYFLNVINCLGFRGRILDGLKLVKVTEKESDVCLFVAPVAFTAKSKTIQ